MNYTKDLETLLFLVNSIDNATSSSSSAALILSPSDTSAASLTLQSILANDGNASSLFFSNLSFENISETLELKQHEYKRDHMALIITVTICYAIIFIAGILGNVITCTVISRNKAMHTATNYYLFNLAVSDLVLLLAGMPNDLYNYWYPSSYPLNQFFCVLQGILSETSTNATVLTITSFTVERYIAICHPFRQHTMSKLSRAVKFIMAIWIMAFCLAIPQAIQYGVIESKNNDRICTMKNILVRHTFEISSFLFFVGPMTLICILYVLIGVKLRKSKILHGVKRNGNECRSGMNGQTRVIRMLVAVVVAFFLCWAPFHAQRIMAVYGKVSGTKSVIFRDIYMVLMYISGVLYFLSTCINPLLYNIMSHKFRDAFKSTLAKHCGYGATEYNNQNRNYSALSKLNGNCGSIKLTTLQHFRQSQNENDQHLSQPRPAPLLLNSKTNNISMIEKDPLFCYTTDTTTTTTTINTPPIIISNNNIVQQQGSTTSNNNNNNNNNKLIKQQQLNNKKMNPLFERSSSTALLNEHNNNNNINNNNNDTLCDNVLQQQSTTTNNHNNINNKKNKILSATDNDDNNNSNKTTKLSTIAEKLRRGTKNVFLLKSTAVQPPPIPSSPKSISNTPTKPITEIVDMETNLKLNKLNSIDDITDDVDCTTTNTISNSSLQEMADDEGEFIVGTESDAGETVEILN